MAAGRKYSQHKTNHYLITPENTQKDINVRNTVGTRAHFQTAGPVICTGFPQLSTAQNIA